ncbi:unnamed protein product, partial [Symbiodinium natans]
MNHMLSNWRVWEVGEVLWNVRKAWDSPASQEERGEALRAGLVQLGPVFVKVGQTLAQRPDVVGEEAAAELKSLQVDAKPFDNRYAYRTIMEDLNHSGPLSPELCPEQCDETQRALFAFFSPDPVAAASLGQVYKAKTHDGVWLAVKVRRPGAARSVALDWACMFVLTKMYRAVRAAYNDFTILADQVASGVFLELDYHNEARNVQ